MLYARPSDTSEAANFFYLKRILICEEKNNKFGDGLHKLALEINYYIEETSDAGRNL